MVLSSVLYHDEHYCEESGTREITDADNQFPRTRDSGGTSSRISRPPPAADPPYVYILRSAQTTIEPKFGGDRSFEVRH